MTNKPSISSFDDDFGFSFADENEITQPVVQEHQSTNQELTQKLQMMYDAIIPLLKNLNKNPEQEYIKWPNRTPKLVQFKEKLDSIGGDYITVKKL